MANNPEKVSRRGILRAIGGASAGILGTSIFAEEAKALSVSGTVSPTEVRAGETVTATVTGSEFTPGSSPSVVVSWGDGASEEVSGTSGIFTHTYASSGTYTVRATACERTGQSISCVLMQVIDTVTVTAPGSSGDAPGHKKVEVCHDGETREVPPNAVDAHLNHGDTLGPCKE